MHRLTSALGAIPGATRRARHPMPARRRAVSGLALAALLTTLVQIPAATSAQAVPSVVPTASSTPAGTVYTPVTPSRVLDPITLGARKTRTFTISGVPSGATAVQLNLTASAASKVTYVSACAAGTSTSTCSKTSALNPSPGVDTPAAVLVALGGSAKNAVTLYNNAGSVRLVADVQGYYVPESNTAGSTFVAVTPYRALSAASFGARSTRVLTISGAPAGATAVALNITASGATSTSYVSVCPTGTSLTTCKKSSVLNPKRGVDSPNLAIVKLGGSGTKQVSIYNNAGRVTLNADVQGFFVKASSAPAGASTLQPVTPQRVLSARAVGGKQSFTVTLPNVPTNATAVALNVTSTAASKVSFVSACPAGLSTSACVRSSTLNPRPKADTANNVLLKLGGSKGNQVTLYNNAGATSLIADVQGYFVDEDGTGSTTPAPTNPTGGTPTASNTGVPSGTSLSVHQGDLTITKDGTVIDSLDVRGFVTVEAANVTIRNTRIRGASASTPRALVMVNGSGYSATIVDSTLVAATASPWVNGVNGSNFTLTRVEIGNVIDQVHIYGNNVLVEDSWLHSNAHFTNDPVQGGGASHDDNIQIQKGSSITIRNNSISGSHNAAIMLTQDTGKVSDLTLDANTLDDGACTVNVKDSSTSPGSITLRDNTFGRTSQYAGCALKMPNTSYDLNLDGNVYTDGKSIAVTR